MDIDQVNKVISLIESTSDPAQQQALLADAMELSEATFNQILDKWRALAEGQPEMAADLNRRIADCVAKRAAYQTMLAASPVSPVAKRPT